MLHIRVTFDEHASESNHQIQPPNSSLKYNLESDPQIQPQINVGCDKNPSKLALTVLLYQSYSVKMQMRRRRRRRRRRRSPVCCHYNILSSIIIAAAAAR
jgi:hypothetical protein